VIFDPHTRNLYADDGEFLKTVECPLALRVQDLHALPNESPDRFCHHCDRTIRCADDLTDSQMRAELEEDEELCIFATPQARHIVLLRPAGAGLGHANPNRSGRPVICTARTLEAINEGACRGFVPLVRRAGPDSTVGPKCMLVQHADTGHVHAVGDCRDNRWEKDGWTVVADWFHVRPDRPFPYAAYLVPRGLPLGHRVYLEDLIEDVPVVYHSQGDSSRLLACDATWLGDDFELEWTPPMPTLG